MTIWAEICPDTFSVPYIWTIYQTSFVYLHFSYKFLLALFLRYTVYPNVLLFSYEYLNVLIIFLWMCWNLILFLFHLILPFMFLQFLLPEELFELSSAHNSVKHAISGQMCFKHALTCTISYPCCPRKHHALRKEKTARHFCISPFMNLWQWHLL